MPIILGVLGFIFFRVTFKLIYHVNLPIFANILVCIGLIFVGTVLNQIMMRRFGVRAAAKRFGYDKPQTKTLSPFLALGLSLIVLSIYSWIISFGFSERFFDRTWDRADGLFELGKVALIFCIPIMLHYAVNNWALNVKLKQIETA